MAIDLSRYVDLLRDAQTVRIRGRVTELTGLVIRAAVPGVRVGELVHIVGRRGTSVRAEVVVDGRAEITGSDRDLALMLKRLGKPVSLAVNKIDSQIRDGLVNEFFDLGIADVFPVSAEHGIGVDAMLDRVTRALPAAKRR